MMRRGSKYWLWADCELHCRSHDEVLSDGTLIDVQTRVSRKGRTQLFVGIYDKMERLYLKRLMTIYPTIR